jgi:two-component system response regulator FixJ
MMARAQGPVFLIDDEAGVRQALASMLSTYDFAVEAFASADDFLAAHGAGDGGCVVADVRMPGMSGLDLQRELVRRGSPLPVVLVTGHGDIPMAVAALKAGAQDFLEKPVDDEALVAAIHRALATSARRQEAASAIAALRARHARLTAREAQVMALVVAGHSNVSIAGQLGLSQRTVEHYRAQVMIKMEVASLAALVQAAAALAEPG